MEAHPLVCYGDHLSLANALSSRDIESFRRALNSPTEVEKHDTETSMTIFEKACQTPDSAQFIEECILAGCDVNKLNPEHNKHPINFVVESHCLENLAALLKDPSTNVNLKGRSFRTPVNSLCQQISDENFRLVFPCIKLLIQHGADVNLPDEREVTPIIHILKNRNLDKANKEIVVKYLLKNVVEVDIDSHRNGIARDLLQTQFPEIELLPNGTTSHNEATKIWDFNRLFLALKGEKENEFLQGLDHIAEKSPDYFHELFTAAEGRETLLIVAIAKNLTRAIEKMIHLGADVNFVVDSTRDTLSPLKCACIHGHWRSLEILLNSPKLNVNSSPLLPIAVRNLGQKAKNAINFEKCFEMLLNHSEIDVNQEDVTHSTALHYAVKFNNSNAILQLLDKGAYIGIRNDFNHLSITDINPKVLEKHFDNCITTNECRVSDQNFEIEFDFRNLVPVQHTQSESLTNEMTALEYMSKTNELKKLMMHPLIASFLTLKWNRLAPFFYLNFILCTLFAVTTVCYIVIFYNYDEPNSIKDCMRIMVFLFTICIAFREMYQFTFSPLTYLKSLENYLECVLIVIVMLILFDVCAENWRRTFAATSILLISIEIFLLAGSLPFWSFCTHYVMLKTVTWSFLKSFLLYAIILLAFSLSFFMLLHEPLKESSVAAKGESNSVDDDDDDGEFNKFSSLGLSILKTLVMSTGEFDVASIHFKTNTFSYIVFLIFLFIVSIVLLNLLNGLAVSDTQVIKSEAELTNFIRRAQVLARYEGVLSASCPSLFQIFVCSDAFDDSKSVCQIRVKPNNNNQILIPNLSNHDEATETEDKFRPLGCISMLSSDRCGRMDSKIIKLAFQVIDKNAEEEEELQEKKLFNDKINKMESILEDIRTKLNNLPGK